MPAMSKILVRSDVDGTTDVTFHPIKDFPFPSWRTNDAGKALLGQSRLDVQWEAPAKPAGKYRVNIKLATPIMEVIPAGTVNSAGVQAAPTVADEESVSCTFFFSSRGTADTRAEMVRAFQHILAGANDVTGTGLIPKNAVAHAFRDATSTLPVPYALANLLFPGS
ncbi:TPA_asm: coat protein [ssRNA phage SRR5466727_1]|uniref:Coat protein n=1 Tax=ssRNA phage SRR5466727_1 TaxID=2786429 RepID=A0A8S5L082_9VIRU|nr:coat protein [ssRNA phage SRR5466727_1]DAD50852.1 TPA_asm: coat protein [ssRNA phage SRR5466727_1]